PPVQPGEDEPADRTRPAVVATLGMLPAFTLLLAFDLGSAMRVLFTIAIVLVSLDRREVRETGLVSVLSASCAGAVAIPFAVLHCWRWRSLASWWCPMPSGGHMRAQSCWRSPWSGYCSARPMATFSRRRWNGVCIRWWVSSTRWECAPSSWHCWAGGKPRPAQVDDHCA